MGIALSGEFAGDLFVSERDLNSRFREDTEGHTRASDLAIDLLHRASRPSADRIRVHPDSPAAASRVAQPPVHPCPLNTAAPPRRECARRGLDPIPPPNREDRTMTETVDRAQAQPPRALGGIQLVTLKNAHDF